ncbi:hypothetical protein [Pseudomonas carnis]|uniref:hypothetical protein n=1 Tax=Pseudomonas carnis TaxID=2487355 RepID=UPI001F2A5B92|nr:hypothetical protein [Pseudomonas carnis]
MGITINKKPELDISGRRWVEIAPGAKILVGSIASPMYKSHQALIKRHLAAIDQQTRVGTKEFKLADIPNAEFEADDDLFIDLASRHLIFDWEGVDISEKPGVQAKYTPELCAQLIRQMPSVYFTAMRAGLDVAVRAEEKAQETAGKRSPRTAGGASGRARQTKKSAGSMNA